MIDRVKFNNEIDKIAKEYLTEINEHALCSFAIKSKHFVDTYFDTLVNECYTGCVGHIKEIDLRLKFTDFELGYRQVMHRWQNENPIKVIDSKSDEFLNQLESKAKRDAITTVATGSVIAIGLFVFGSHLMALAVELLTVALSYFAYQKGKQKDLENLKKQYVKAVKTDLLKWLEYAEKASNEYLKEFKLFENNIG